MTMDPPKDRNEHQVPSMIKTFLEKEKMTPADLASTLNVAETTVYRWLKGEAKPTGTAAAVLWTLIGLGSVAIGAGASGLLGAASVAARILRGASVGVGVLASGVGIYRLLRNRLEQHENLEREIESLTEREKLSREVDDMRRKLADAEKKLAEMGQEPGPGESQ